MTRHWRWWLLGLAAVLLMAVVYERTTRYLWSGVTDLEIEVVVTDADTGQPVEAAEVFLYLGSGESDTLSTDRNGIVRRTTYTNTGGAMSPLRTTDTRTVDLRFRVQVSAPGYEPSPVIDLKSYQGQVQRTGPRSDKLVVPVRLRKGPAEPPG
jgi:hypothetical protein